MKRLFWLVFMILVAGCANNALPTPTREQVADIERFITPPVIVTKTAVPTIPLPKTVSPTNTKEPTTLPYRTPVLPPTPSPSPIFVIPIVTATPTEKSFLSSIRRFIVPFKNEQTPTATPTVPTSTPVPTPTLTPMPPTPLPTLVGTAQTVRVPILMYHYVSVPPAGSDIYRTDLSVTPDNLRAQLAWLKENGYTSIDMYTLSRAIANREALPDKPIILTFDDGHRDHYTDAFPILQEFGMTGTFFVITQLADSWNVNHLTWPMIVEMDAAGMSMEMHTHTHPDLTLRTRGNIFDEIAQSHNALAHHLNKPSRYLAYPGGDYNEIVLDVVYELGLWGAVTTEYGGDQTWNGRFTMPRYRIRNTTTVAQFANIVE